MLDELSNWLPREVFLSGLAGRLAAVMERAMGPRRVASFMRAIAMGIAAQVDQDIRITRGIDYTLTLDEFREVTDELIHQITPESCILEANADFIVVEVVGSVLHQFLPTEWDFDEMGALILAAIAALNFDFCKVNRQIVGERDGQAVSRITIYVRDTEVCRQASGEEFYRSIVESFARPDIQIYMAEEEGSRKEKLEKEVRQVKEENLHMKAIAAIATVISQSLDTRETLASGLQTLMDAIGIEVGVIFGVDQSSKHLEILYHSGISADMANEILFEHILPPSAPAGKERWDSILEIPRVSPPHWHCGDFQCYASAPMRVQDRPTGLVLLMARLRKRFDVSAIHLLQAAANELGFGLENMRLYDEQVLQVQRLEVLQEVTGRLNRCNKLEDVLSVAANSVVHKLRFDRVGIFLLSRDGTQLECVYGTDDKGNLLNDCHTTVPIGPDGGTLSRAVIERKPLYVSDLRNEPVISLDPEEAEALANLHIFAFARVPLIAEGRVVGVISVDNKVHYKPITRDELRTLMIFGNHLATAIENTRYTEDLIHSAAELQKVDALRSQFVSMISHEFRSPLHTIRNAAAVVLQGETDPVRLKWGTTVVRQTNILAELVDNLITQSRIQQSAVKISGELCHLKALVSSVITEMRASELLQFQEVVVDCAPELCVRVDPYYFKLIVRNLLSNAIKASPKDGRMDIQAQATGNMVRVTVQDYGVGIAPDQLPTVFERWVSFGKDKIEPAQRGLGLGLHIVRTLVEMQGGTIHVESEAGKGSAFMFTVPIAIEETEQE